MSQKERIIELVRQGVITADEALDLLESQYKQADRSATDYYSKEYEADLNEFQQESELSSQIRELEEHVEKLKKEKTIAQQKIRELDILEDLEDLNDESIKQREDYQVKLTELEETLDQKQATLDQLHQQAKIEGSEFESNQGKRFADYADQASQEGERIARKVKTFTQDLLDNFNWKEINLQVPWLKTNEWSHRLEMPASSIDRLDLAINNGSIQVVETDQDKIILDCQVTFFGNEPEDLQQEFNRLVTFEKDRNKLIFHANAARIAVDVTVGLPKNEYQSLEVNLWNGDCQMVGGQFKELKVENKNGNISLKDVQLDQVELATLNGDVLMESSQWQTSQVNTLKGDIRLLGAIADSQVESQLGTIYLTKQDLKPANIQARCLHGDIKLALPNQQACSIVAKAQNGQVLNRLSGMEDGQEQVKVKEIQRSGHEQVKGHLQAVSGNIYLKDNE
ncbi:DUF4097 family beta strand repeat-containing protein [Hutsoniella sourekii]